MSDHGVVKQGYVRQRSKKLGGVWQKRWLVLRKCPNMGPARLESYASETDWRKYNTDVDNGRLRSYLGSCRKSKVYLLDERPPKGGPISVSRLPSSIRKFSFCVCFQTSNSENGRNVVGGGVGGDNYDHGNDNDESDVPPPLMGVNDAGGRVGGGRVGGGVGPGRRGGGGPGPGGGGRAPSTTRRSDGKIKTFACESNYDADGWVKAIQAEAGQLAEPGSGLVALGGAPDVVASSLRKELLNDTFRVFLVSTTALDACGDCLLQVAPENLYVYSLHEPRERLAVWPLTALRRYGSDSEKFTFEAGRHCATGEGLFVFYGPHSESIYQRVHQATLAIAAQANALEPTAPQYERRASIGSAMPATGAGAGGGGGNGTGAACTGGLRRPHPLHQHVTQQHQQGSLSFNELRNNSLDEGLNTSFVASTTTTHFMTSSLGVVKSTPNPISFRSHLLSLSAHPSAHDDGGGGGGVD